MKLRIVPYKRGSRSARILAEKLSALVGYKVFRGKPRLSRKNIMWGSTIGFDPGLGSYVNHPEAVANARNKIWTFERLEGVCSIPPYTTDKAIAEGWIADGKTVLARTPSGQAGSGISVCTSDTGLVDAPLYTLYIKKRKEYRVHVINGQAVAVYEKRRKVGQQSDPIIRSHRRGWVFCKLNVSEPDGLRELAVNAVRALGLDFGGVDVIWNEKQNRCYVLEINTAPGLCNQTGDLYAAGIQGSCS